MTAPALHPTEVTSSDPADQPVSAQTGARLLAKIGLTEGEAQRILQTEPATPEQLALATRVDLHALMHALSASTVTALVTDKKIDLGPLPDDFSARAAKLRELGAAEDKLQLVIEDLHGAARLDASTVQEVINTVVPQIRSRSRANPVVRRTYSPLLAYQHARYPGHRGSGHGHASPPAPAK